MAVTIVFTGDTKTVRASFTNIVDEGQPPGTLVDPDSNIATVTVYNADEVSIETGNATRVSAGIYTYIWTAPLVPGTYWIEFKGLFNTKAHLARRKFYVKFKGDQ